MAFKNLLSGVRMGSWKTPELGITEFIGGLFGRPRDPVTGGSQIFKGGTQTPPPPPPPPPPPSGPSVTQNWWEKQSAPIAPSGVSQPVYNPDTSRQQQEDAERARQAEYESRVRGEIGAAYEPIFASLDERLNQLPADRTELEKSIETLVENQVKSVGIEKEAGLRRIGTTEEGVTLQAADTRREVEENIRSSMKAWREYLGAMGAGDSSAIGLAGEAVTKEANRQVGKVLTARDRELNNLGQRRLDVADMAGVETLKVDSWKTSKLTDIVGEFNTRRDNLLSQKASATAERASSIANLILNSQQQFVARLRQLDDQVTSYKANVQLWAEQRSAELEDYATKLKMQATYEPQAGPTYTKALQDFNRLTQVEGVSRNQAREAIIKQYGIDPLGGLILSGGNEESDEDVKTFTDWIQSAY